MRPTATHCQFSKPGPTRLHRLIGRELILTVNSGDRHPFGSTPSSTGPSPPPAFPKCARLAALEEVSFLMRQMRHGDESGSFRSVVRGRLHLVRFQSGATGGLVTLSTLNWPALFVVFLAGGMPAAGWGAAWRTTTADLPRPRRGADRLRLRGPPRARGPHRNRSHALPDTAGILAQRQGTRRGHPRGSSRNTEQINWTDDDRMGCCPAPACRRRS
jgi:hypothetical protein